MTNHSIPFGAENTAARPESPDEGECAASHAAALSSSSRNVQDLRSEACVTAVSLPRRRSVPSQA